MTWLDYTDNCIGLINDAYDAVLAAEDGDETLHHLKAAQGHLTDALKDVNDAIREFENENERRAEASDNDHEGAAALRLQHFDLPRFANDLLKGGV